MPFPAERDSLELIVALTYLADHTQMLEVGGNKAKSKSMGLTSQIIGCIMLANQ